MKLLLSELEVMSGEELLNYVVDNGFYLKEKGINRGEEVLNLLSEKPLSIYEIGVILNLSGKNISSILCSLKKKGIVIYTDNMGRKVLMKGGE